ncbi:MAG: hypothetical protein LQ340_004078 [Diploschistes diacapsis]|nr:MAG: hypothetical protein LQ340_004078 [Diploschistes diacapsis]
MTDSSLPDSGEKDCYPTTLGFTPVNNSGVLQHNDSSLEKQPAQKRRKTNQRKTPKSLSQTLKPKRTSSKLTAKVTKPCQEDAISSRTPSWGKGSLLERHLGDEELNLDNEEASKQLQEPIKRKLAGFRYTVPNAEVHQNANEPHLHGQQCAIDNEEEPPPSHQLERDVLLSNEDESSCRDNQGPHERVQRRRLLDETTTLQAPPSDLALYTPSSNHTVPTQLRPGNEVIDFSEWLETEADSQPEEFDGDEEETAAFLELTETTSVASLPAQTANISAEPPANVLIPSTQAKIPASPPSPPHRVSLDFSTIPSLHFNNSHTAHYQPPSPTSISTPSPTSPPRPFMRGLHPPSLTRRSPIPGLSPTPRILTCFRLGEAINVTSRARRAGHPVQVELYARVLSSTRVGDVQHFRFADLWYKPPKGGLVIEGMWKGWKDVEMWERDGEAFLDGIDAASGEGKLSRIVGRLERKAAGGWNIEVGTCWEVEWGDVEVVKGIVCA